MWTILKTLVLRGILARTGLGALGWLAALVPLGFLLKWIALPILLLLGFLALPFLTLLIVAVLLLVRWLLRSETKMAANA